MWSVEILLGNKESSDLTGWNFHQRRSMAKPIIYNMKKLSKDVTLTVAIHETYQWRIRRFVGLNLIKLATLIMGCGLNVVSSQKEE